MNTEYQNNSTIIKEKLSSVLIKPVMVVGAGPSIINDLKPIINLFNRKLSFIAVDGTCTLFQRLNFPPDIVITDLDGEWNAILWAILNGSITLIHAHGDNFNLIKAFFNQNNKLLNTNLIWGTTQIDLQTNLFNYGGFTDGDRAIFLTFHYQSPIIALAGFDFGEEIGEFSMLNPFILKDPERKIKKFSIAKHLLDTYYDLHSGNRFNLTSQGENLKGFPKVSLDRFNRIIVQWYTKQNKSGSPKP